MRDHKAFEERRRRLVEMLRSEGIIRSEKVAEAMLGVPREQFVPPNLREQAYLDTPLPIGWGQTISAPHMCCMICEYLDLQVGDKVLEIGTGSGYQAALVSEIVAPKTAENPGHVYSVEIVQELVRFSTDNLARTGHLDRVTVIAGDGSMGYSEKHPYDRILVTAASPGVPPPLVDQMKEGGKMILPVDKGFFTQVLCLVEKENGETKEKPLMPVAFVPLRGAYGFRR